MEELIKAMKKAEHDNNYRIPTEQCEKIIKILKAVEAFLNS